MPIKFDVSGNDSYTCVEFDVSSGAKGFGIIDLSTYDVVMYALDATMPFTRTDTIVYNGYLVLRLSIKTTQPQFWIPIQKSLKMNCMTHLAMV